MVTPIFAMTVNKIDVTKSIQEKLVFLEYVDYANLKSDELKFEVAGSYNIPKEEDVIELWIGYKETGVWSCGTFVVQSLPFNKTNTTIRATATNFTQNLKSKNTKTYKEQTVKQIVETVASRNKLEIKCNIEESLKYIIQKDESDLHFLTRLAKEHDAVFKIKRDILIFLKKEDTTKVIIDLNECRSYSGEFKKREKYGTVEAKWHNSKENRDESVKVGTGEPVLKLQEFYYDETEAKQRAEKALQEQKRKEFKGSLSIYGMDIVAGSKLVLSGDSRLEGREFSVTKVAHNLGAGFVSGVEFEG